VEQRHRILTLLPHAIHPRQWGRTQRVFCWQDEETVLGKSEKVEVVGVVTEGARAQKVTHVCARPAADFRSRMMQTRKAGLLFSLTVLHPACLSPQWYLSSRLVEEVRAGHSALQQATGRSSTSNVSTKRCGATLHANLTSYLLFLRSSIMLFCITVLPALP
jgi:hypothetical protein